MIHYHGTPITPREQLLRMAGRHFCVSFISPQDLKTCLQVGQSLMFDNGAFSVFTRGERFDERGYYEWLEPILGHPHWAVIPDVIGGTVEQQMELVKRWPFPKDLGLPVWHLNLDLDYLVELADEFGRLCIGSAGEYWQVGGDRWCSRMDEAMNYLAGRRARLPWLHGLRMLGQAGMRWPLSSADSTNVAQNFKRDVGCAECKASRIDAVQSPIRWKFHETQVHLFS